MAIRKMNYELIKSFIQQKNIDKAKEYWINKGQEHIVREELVNEVEQLFIKAEK